MPWGMKWFGGNMEISREQLIERINELREQHRQLDEAIDRLMVESPVDQLRVRRLKKEKLLRKDEIAVLEDQLFPDIIA